MRVVLSMQNLTSGTPWTKINFQGWSCFCEVYFAPQKWTSTWYGSKKTVIMTKARVANGWLPIPSIVSFRQNQDMRTATKRILPYPKWMDQWSNSPPTRSFKGGYLEAHVFLIFWWTPWCCFRASIGNRKKIQLNLGVSPVNHHILTRKIQSMKLSPVNMLITSAMSRWGYKWSVLILIHGSTCRGLSFLLKLIREIFGLCSDFMN